MDLEKGILECSDFQGALLMLHLRNLSVVKLPRRTLRELYSVPIKEIGDICDAWTNPSKSTVRTNIGEVNFTDFEAYFLFRGPWFVEIGASFRVLEEDIDIEVTPIVLGSESRGILLEKHKNASQKFSLRDMFERESSLVISKKMKRNEFHGEEILDDRDNEYPPPQKRAKNENNL